MDPELISEKISKYVGIDVKTKTQIDVLQRLHKGLSENQFVDSQRPQSIPDYLKSRPSVNTTLLTFFKADVVSDRSNYFSEEIVQYVQSKFFVRASLKFLPRTNNQDVTRYGVNIDNGAFFDTASELVIELFKRFPKEAKAIKKILEGLDVELTSCLGWCQEPEMTQGINTFQTELKEEIAKL